ncbi:MAG: transpeptidase family protein [Bacteroidales bacterium]|nr:transpeptidase family protein [Bacteroidales bacterium]
MTEEVSKNKLTASFHMILLLAMFIGLAILIMYRVAVIQFFDTEKWVEKGEKIHNNTRKIPYTRGNICADDGSILATSVPYYWLRLDLKAPIVAKVYKENVALLCREVAAFFKTDATALRKRMDAELLKGNRWFLIYNEKVSFAKLQEFKRLSSLSRDRFGSALIEDMDSNRILPNDDMASRTIGIMSKSPYGGVHGPIGYTGIEGLMESYLAGTDGKAILKNMSGAWTPVPVEEPQHGKDVITTLNLNLQDFTENALLRQMQISQAAWGAAIVMEVKTGKIKAVANLGRKADGSYAETYNYALGNMGCSEPGSTFKLVSLMAALEQGVVDTSTVIDLGSGRWEYRTQPITDSDYGKRTHGAISVKKIFEISSNVGTAKAIVKSFEGRERDFVNRIYQFGLNKPLNMGFAGEGRPIIKNPDSKDWWGASLAQMAYGYELKVTPMQMAAFYNAVANGGKMMKPMFVTEVREKGLPVKTFQPEVMNPAICSKETLGKVRAMLEGVCIRGTGRGMKFPYFPLAGKTGTAQIAFNDQGYGSTHQYQASFVGYFPADTPEYTVMVVISGPKGAYYGGSVAMPVFKEVVERTYAAFLEPRLKDDDVVRRIPEFKAGFHDGVSHVANVLKLPVNADKSSKSSSVVSIAVNDDKAVAVPVAITKDEVPDVKGMGGRDALYLLESSGLHVKLNGFGKVNRQSVPPGTKIKKGQTVMLELSI